MPKIIHENHQAAEHTCASCKSTVSFTRADCEVLSAPSYFSFTFDVGPRVVVRCPVCKDTTPSRELTWVDASAPVAATPPEPKEPA